jgi:putative ABC transport system permease protein
VAAAPAPGTVWVDAGVLDALQLGWATSLLLGDAGCDHRPPGGRRARPRRRLHGFRAARAVATTADLAATGLVQPASRVTYRLAVAARTGQTPSRGGRVRALGEAQIEPGALRGVRVESLQSGRPEMQQTLDRAGKFLNLVALLAALLAAVAVAIAARDFAQRHLDDCAMLRVLGRRSGAIAGPMRWSSVGRPAGQRAGVALGFAVHFVFVWLLSGLLDAPTAAGPGPCRRCSAWAWA